jgi:TRAP-type C4-dicarboxylate transport system substrate-binding protein
VKKVLLIILIIATMSIPTLIGACGTPTPTPSTTQEPKTTPTETQEPIEIILTNATPAAAPVSQNTQKMGDMIEEKSGGRVKFVYYWASTLIPVAEFVKSVRSGSVDIVHLAGDQTQIYMPITYEIISLPFMGYKSMTDATSIYNQLYAKYPEIQQEFDGMKLLSIMSMPPVQMHTTKKVVKYPEDAQGVKFAFTAIGSTAKMISLAGGTPVQVAVGDMNVSLTTGVTDGFIDHFPVTNAFGIVPALPYHTVFGDGGMSMVLMGFVMNEAKWNSLPPDIQEIFEEASAWFVEEQTKVQGEQIKKVISMAEEMGHTFTYLTPEEIQLWADIGIQLHDEWITETEAKGMPAQSIYDEAKRLIAESK